jgi:hypothetical protein
MLLIKRVRKIKVKINRLTLSALLVLCIAMAIPVHAAFIGDTITGVGVQGGDMTNIFSPSDVQTSDADVEYLGEVDAIYEPDTVGDPISTGRLQFDFVSAGSETYLLLTAFRTDGTGGIWEIPDVVVTFSGLDYSDPNFVLTGLELTPITDDQNPYYANPTQGITANIGADFIEFTLANFRISETRDMEFRLIFEETDGGPNTPVVPVPAAAPMALLGLGVLALARRLRRKTS